METQKFKTNIKCTGCLARVTPILNETAGKDNWKVDVNDPQKILTVIGDVNVNEIIATVEEAGFRAEVIA